MKYFTFGMETMRITQDYNGKASHYNHSHGSPKDYPIDVAGVDGGQSAYFATVDMKVTAIKGVGNSSTNTIWLESTEKVTTPTFNDFVWITLTHWNDGSKTAKYKVGDVIKKGDIIAYEGTDGASANHLHLVCGKGHSNNWVKNSKGSWVIKGDSLPPEEVMYIDPKFTKIVDNKNLKFKEVPKEEPKEDKTEAFFPKKGYFSLGDNHKNIGKIAEFMYKTFPSYTNKKALGNYYGPYLQSSIKEFQKRAKAEKKYDAEIDGNVGPKTLKALKKYGFKE